MGRMLASQEQEICIMHWTRKLPKSPTGDTCMGFAHISLGVESGVKEGDEEGAERERRQVQAWMFGFR